jgi:hypothetical protein
LSRTTSLARTTDEISIIAIEVADRDVAESGCVESLPMVEPLLPRITASQSSATPVAARAGLHLHHRRRTSRPAGNPPGMQL